MKNKIRHLKSEGELFKRILGDQWLKLHPDIQRRFEKNPSPKTPLRYEGTLEELSCSFWGRIIAYITRPLIGGALIPFTAYNFPVHIQVYSRENCPHIFKHRIYNLPNKRQIEFTSYMREGPNGEALEYVGAGLGMKLLVFEKEANLHFKSDGYFWDIGIYRIPIPNILTPGETYLTHINEGQDSFRIRIDIRHKIFGKMFVQAGVFKEIKST